MARLPELRGLAIQLVLQGETDRLSSASLDHKYDLRGSECPELLLG